MAGVNRKHRDRLFSFLFGEEENKEWTLSLYNAVNGTGYTDAGSIEFTTMEDAVYMGMKNDVSFVICQVMNIYGQQSTHNPNMPIRRLMYAAKLYDKYIRQKKLNIYGKRPVSFPVPRLVVFYNGTEGEDDQILKLSDAFNQEGDPGIADIEARVRMINVNYGKNGGLMAACRPLKEYAWIVKKIRKNRASPGTEGAIDEAINSMPVDFEIRQFLMGHRAEVKDMCITEDNEAETLQMIREEGREEGARKTARKTARNMLKRGILFDEIAEILELPIDTIRAWAKEPGMPV